MPTYIRKARQSAVEIEHCRVAVDAWRKRALQLVEELAQRRLNMAAMPDERYEEVTQGLEKLMGEHELVKAPTVCAPGSGTESWRLEFWVNYDERVEGVSRRRKQQIVGRKMVAVTLCSCWVHSCYGKYLESIHNKMMGRAIGWDDEVHPHDMANAEEFRDMVRCAGHLLPHGWITTFVGDPPDRTTEGDHLWFGGGGSGVFIENNPDFLNGANRVWIATISWRY